MDTEAMGWITLLQWPAMAVTVFGAWLVASSSARRRKAGFYVYVLSNLLWSVWGVYAQAYALVVLQLALFAMNLRGLSRNQPEAAREEK